MTWSWSRGGFWLVLLSIVGCLTPTVYGQTPPPINNLLVEIWPEYDRAEVLVIYRGQLSAETPLPAQVAIPLPGYIDTLHVVATEQNGSLFEVDPTEVALRQEGEMTVATFPATAPGFQLEYYDPVILSRTGQTRSLDFTFTTLSPIEVVTLEVQEPLGAANFSMSPQAENSFVGNDGLRYNTIGRTDLAAGETLDIAATYDRQTEALTAPSLAANDSGAPLLEVESPASVTNNLRFAYLLIGIGIALLLFAAGSWWWSRRRVAAADAPRRRPARKQPKSKRKPAPAQPDAEAGSKFCYQCGSALRDDAQFCHSCGAERR